MEYQKIANLLDSALNKPSKFRTRNQVEVNDDIRGAYSPNKKIRFKTAMLSFSLCDQTADPNNRNKKVIFKSCAPFTNCISKINNTQIDNAEYIDVW